MIKSRLCPAFIALFLYGTLSAQELLVSAAMSLKDAFFAVGKEYERTHTGMTITFNFAASGALRAQIEAGAPADIFASASEKDMDLLAGKALIAGESRRIFARNELVFICNVKKKIVLSSIEDLNDATITKIAIGNPVSVPAGTYAQQVFAYYKIGETIRGKLIFGESVRQVLDYVSRGEVDIGAVYSTDALTDKNVAVALAVPAEAAPGIAYPIAVIAATKKRERSREFIDFVLSPEARKILDSFGFKR